MVADAKFPIAEHDAVGQVLFFRFFIVFPFDFGYRFQSVLHGRDRPAGAQTLGFIY